MGLNFFKKIHTLLFKPKIVKPEGEPMNAVVDKPETSPPIAENDPKEDVCGQVMTKLGKPPNFHRCTACHIPGTLNYRVNVWERVWNSSGSFSNTELITDSFFITVNEKGEITKPEIKWKYTNVEKM